jgi:hypothetical protein
MPLSALDDLALPGPARAAAGLALVLLALFVALLVAAMFVYPGGSWVDPQADGFRPGVNYWCDLMRTVAPDGRPNAAAATLAQGAFAALALSLAAFWPAAASLATPRLARWGLRCGLLASAGVALVALTPYDTQREWHAVSTLGAGGTGVAAAVLLVAGSLRAGPLARWRHAWSAALLAASAANIVVYTDCVLRQRESAALPVIQLAATVFLVLWMASTALDARAASRAA